MIIAPSVLSLHYDDTQQQIRELNGSGAQWMHFDVMDGHFVRNLTFGPDILKAFCRTSPLLKDVHLMVSDPVFFADVFMDAGADLITFHYEALETEEQMHDLIAHIHERGKKAGISVKPATPVSVLEPFIGKVDLVLIMSVEPGFGGQAFMPEALEKISAVRKMAEGKDLLIEVDGGINAETGKACRDAGCDVLVAGSYVFKKDIKEAVSSLV